METATKLAGVALVAVIGVVALAIGYWSVSAYTACRDAGSSVGIATSWSPAGGCTATILGTKVRLDR